MLSADFGYVGLLKLRLQDAERAKQIAPCCCCLVDHDTSQLWKLQNTLRVTRKPPFDSADYHCESDRQGQYDVEGK